jgi:endonuclease/exonuclease/phosphatase family metal-dependent hydrolase
MTAFRNHQVLTHELHPHYPTLRAMPSAAALRESPLYARIGPDLEALLAGVERGDHPDPIPRAHPDRVRFAAWNIQRGKHFHGLLRALQQDPILAATDVLLLSEVDNGLGRSDNRNVARDLAAALRMHYAFTVNYLTLEDDWGENPEARENTLALAGAAVLSRIPLRRVENIDLPALRDKLSGSEKRLGKKRALLAELDLPGGPLAAACCHLDSNASPRQRAAQLDVVLRRLEASSAARLLGGGDLNTTTYDASATLPLLRDILHKFFITGFRNTVDGYMTPERRYERPIFEALAAHGFTTEGWNDRARGTLHYDLNSPYAIQKTRKKVGGLLTALLRRLLRPWGGVVPARLDWFFGRGVAPLWAAVVDPREPDGSPVSDHAAVVVDLAP